MNDINHNDIKPLSLLIVDDDDIDRESIKRALRNSHRPLNIIEANTGRKGINQFEEQQIDVLLIDYRLPDIDGFSVIRALQEKENVCTIIMVSQHEDEAISSQALTIGAHDFLLKSEVNSERLTRTIYQAQHRYILEKELRDKTHSLKNLAQTDFLTGLINRRAFEHILQQSYIESEITSGTVAVLFIDLDRFKPVNDQHGHLTGDDMLRNIADLCQQVVSNYGVTGRWGGEEFIILLPDHASDKLLNRLNELREGLAKLPFKFKQERLTVTASIGGTQCRTGEKLDAAFERADKGLYKAKSGGRNQVVIQDNE